MSFTKNPIFEKKSKNVEKGGNFVFVVWSRFRKMANPESAIYTSHFAVQLFPLLATVCL
jgi:hypothetical protein